MPATIDIILRTAAVMGLLLLAAVLAAGGLQRRATLPGMAFCLAVAAFVLTSVPGGADYLGDWRVPLTALCVTKAVWFWLLARALFAEDPVLRRGNLGVLAGVALAGSWQQLVFLPRFRAGTAGIWESLAGFAVDAVLLVFVALALHEAWRGLAADLAERRRRLRLGFLAATGAYLAVALAVQGYNLLLGVGTPDGLVRANLLLLTVLSLAAVRMLVQPRAEHWLDPAPRRAGPTPLTRREQTVLTALNRALERDRVYLEDGLTIGALAARLGTGEHVLRRVINRGMGYRNFNDFLHAWRIREACEELTRPEQSRQPVLSIAMKVGYGSIGAFNRAFKARTGMTPTAFRRRHAQGAAPSA
jgi:AraC-like DNA-binding protein